MKITVLGSGSGGPFSGRYFTAHMLQMGRYHFLLDCGEGTQMQCHRFGIAIERIDYIFITHLHGDHVFGLAGLLSSMSMKGRQKPLHIYSPPNLAKLIDIHAEICGMHRDFQINFHEVSLDSAVMLLENEQLEVWAIPLEHRLTTNGYIFKEMPKLLNIRKEAITEYALTVAQIKSIKSGMDLLLDSGQTVKNAELTLLPEPPMSYAFCTDTIYNEMLAPHLEGVHTLYHEATFTDEHTVEAAKTFHSTATQAARIAAAAGVKRLILGHFSTRYKDEQVHLQEARKIFGNTVAAVEGDVYE